MEHIRQFLSKNRYLFDNNEIARQAGVNIRTVQRHLSGDSTAKQALIFELCLDAISDKLNANILLSKDRIIENKEIIKQTNKYRKSL